MSKRMVRSSRECIAAHEAGHAVVAMLLGQSWDYVTLDSAKFTIPRLYGDDPFVAHIEHDTLTLTGKESGMFSMAGVAGQYLHYDKTLPKRVRLNSDFVEREGLRSPQMTGDYNCAEDAAMDVLGEEYYDEDIERFISGCMHEAYALLGANKELHTRITAMLVEHGTVWSKEVARLTTSHEFCSTACMTCH